MFRWFKKKNTRRCLYVITYDRQTTRGLLRTAGLVYAPTKKLALEAAKKNEIEVLTIHKCQK